MRPLTQEEFERRKHLERIGHAGQVVDSIAKDPWGTIGAGLVIAAGVGLCFVSGPIGAAVLIGVGISAGIGVATGHFNPRIVALSGVASGLTAGVGSSLAGLANSGAGAVLGRMGGWALGGAVGNAFAQRGLGRRFSWTSMAETAGLSGLVAGLAPWVGQKMGSMASRLFSQGDEAGTRSFFTVQDIADAARLRSGGNPWPTSATRAALGQGVYSFGSQAEAAAYATELTAHGVPSLQILRLDVASRDLASFRSLDIDALEDPGAFMSKYSRLWGGDPTHGYDYLTRGTHFGVEHFFSKSVAHMLKFGD
jgi:hypothetical protein